jgi:hypothetical protein
MMSLDDFEWEWNHRTDAEKQKYEASLKVAHERELAWLAEMAAKAAREATRWFTATLPTFARSKPSRRSADHESTVR